jgi:AraC-like DNA-binding protein
LNGILKSLFSVFMFTVDTHCILPGPMLQPYVRCFAMRHFDTDGRLLPKTMLVDHEMSMVFFLHSKLFGFDAIDKKAPAYIVKENGYAECCFTGPQTFIKGAVIFKGVTTLLNIHFKPVGFFHIFNIRPQELIDKMVDNEELLSKEVLLVQEQLHEAPTLKDCITLLEKFLINKIVSQKPKYRHRGIVWAADLLIQQKGFCSIKKLAHHCNMTLQTFEVQFIEQVGLSPKIFSRLLRFGLAVDLKLYQPDKSWTQIAHTCGYFDQAHFIKEFKKFTFLTPNKFIKTMHPVLENFDSDY